MGYRRPTCQPGHELAERERRIDVHLAEAGERRERRLRGLRRVDRSLLVGRWAVAFLALLLGTLGVFAESQQTRLQALCAFTVVLLWWVLRLLFAIFR